MSNKGVFPSLLFKINQNELALEAVVMALTLCVERNRSDDIAQNVRGTIGVIDWSKEFINMTLAVLMTPE